MLAATAAAALLLSAAPGLHDCNATGGLGHSACPNNATCCVEQYFGANGCIFAGTTQCCSPGPPLEPSTTLPNCLVIGDSVSDQYTPSVAELLKETCQVQHAPWVGGGSANNAANGLYNLQNCRWLRTATRPDLHVDWDIIHFNFGLHDLQKTTQEELDLYESQLENITRILLASGARHVQYALTTPFQADATPGCGPYCNKPNSSSGGAAAAVAARAPAHSGGGGRPGFLAASSSPSSSSSSSSSSPALGGTWPQPLNGGNGRCGPPVCEAGSLGCGVPNATAKAEGPDPEAPGCGPPTYAVAGLNERAEQVMVRNNVTILDLNSVVHAQCGANYTNCSLCDDETQYMGIRCGYHYAPAGVSLLAHAVADSFTRLLGQQN